MTELWELRDWMGELRLRSWPVTKETAKAYFLDIGERRHRRVEKKFVDTKPSQFSMSYGRFYTTRASAIVLWNRYLENRIRHDERIREALTNLTLDIEATVMSYREKEETDGTDHYRAE